MLQGLINFALTVPAAGGVFLLAALASRRLEKWAKRSQFSGSRPGEPSA